MKTSTMLLTLSAIMAVFGALYWLVVNEFGATANAAILLALWAIVQTIREHTAEMRDQMERDREARWNIAAGNPRTK